MTKRDELQREANKLQGELLTLLDHTPMPQVVKPLVRAVIGRLHGILSQLIQEQK